MRREFADNPENGMKKYRVMFAEGKGIFWDKGVTFNHKVGLPLVGVEKYLAARKET